MGLHPWPELGHATIVFPLKHTIKWRCCCAFCFFPMSTRPIQVRERCSSATNTVAGLLRGQACAGVATGGIGIQVLQHNCRHNPLLGAWRLARHACRGLQPWISHGLLLFPLLLVYCTAPTSSTLACLRCPLISFRARLHCMAMPLACTGERTLHEPVSPCKVAPVLFHGALRVTCCDVVCRQLIAWSCCNEDHPEPTDTASELVLFVAS